VAIQSEQTRLALDNNEQALPHLLLDRDCQKERAMILLKRLLLAAVCILVLGLIGWCAISEYTARTMSAGVVLDRLAGVTDRPANDETVRRAFLQRIPVGTADTEIITFLEQHGVERDRFTGGQFYRYQVQDNQRTILALLTSPPWIINVFCGPGNYGVRFVLDEQRTLKDIVIENYTVCL
jgi:hypothetical protein